MADIPGCDAGITSVSTRFFRVTRAADAVSLVQADPAMTTTATAPFTSQARAKQIVQVGDEIIPRAHGRRGRRLSWRCLRVVERAPEPLRIGA